MIEKIDDESSLSLICEKINELTDEINKIGSVIGQKRMKEMANNIKKHGKAPKINKKPS